MTEQVFEGITTVRTGRVAELLLDRPAALNALDTKLAEALTRAAQVLAADPDISVLVISSSSPRAFCVGADLKERAGFTEADLLAQRPVFRAAFEAVRALPMPVVAAVSGYALGGGFELALSGDVIVADDTAVFGLPEVGVGLVPGCGGTQLLARRVGAGRAADLLFSARRVAMPAAELLGIVDRSSGDVPARDAALALAGEMAAASPVALRQAKRALRAGLETGLAAGLEAEDAAWRAAVASPDRREGIAAFVEKRPPVWGRLS